MTAPCRLGPPANDDGPAPFASADGRAVIHPAGRMVRLAHVGASGLTVSITLPLAHYSGVSADVAVGAQALDIGFRLVLAHADPGLDVELYRAADDRDLVAAWRGFARDLGLPMLMRTEAGDVGTGARIGALEVGQPSPRRAPRAFLKRRPQALRRRKVGVARVGG